MTSYNNLLVTFAAVRRLVDGLRNEEIGSADAMSRLDAETWLEGAERDVERARQAYAAAMVDAHAKGADHLRALAVIDHRLRDEGDPPPAGLQVQTPPVAPRLPPKPPTPAAPAAPPAAPRPFSEVVRGRDPAEHPPTFDGRFPRTPPSTKTPIRVPPLPPRPPARSNHVPQAAPAQAPGSPATAAPGPGGAQHRPDGAGPGAAPPGRLLGALGRGGPAVADEVDEAGPQERPAPAAPVGPGRGVLPQRLPPRPAVVTAKRPRPEPCAPVPDDDLIPF